MAALCVCVCGGVCVCGDGGGVCVGWRWWCAGVVVVVAGCVLAWGVGGWRVVECVGGG